MIKYALLLSDIGVECGRCISGGFYFPGSNSCLRNLYTPIPQVSIILFLKSVSSKKMSWRMWFPWNMNAFGSHFLICRLAFRKREWKNPEPNVVTTSYTQYGRFWGSINAILKYKQCGLQCMCSGHSKVECIVAKSVFESGNLFFRRNFHIIEEEFS